MSDVQHLVQMANDIGNFFRGQAGREAAITSIENHINHYWTRSMQKKLFAQLDRGVVGLDDLPLAAVQHLRNNPQFKSIPPPGGDAG
jgi:formate dehydrogenase subunit delta